MDKSVMNTLGKVARSRASIRQRLFWLLGGMSLATLLVVNLVWLPGTIHDIRETHEELQRVAVRGSPGPDRALPGGEGTGPQEPGDAASAPHSSQATRLTLRQLAHRFFQREPAFVEIGILDAQGREQLRVSRVLAITDRDLSDRSASELFQEGRLQEVYWGPVMTTETSEPWVTLAVPLEAFEGHHSWRGLWHRQPQIALGGHGRACSSARVAESMWWTS